jgi:hypothetical protein
MKHGARNFKSVAFVLAVLSVMALTSLNMLGQATSGNLVGTVFDASGAAVVGADVEVTNVATNAVTRSKTNGTGEYRADNLLPGTYRVSVKAQGFKAFAQTTDVQLNTTGTINVTLTPGAATETVEVSGAPPIIDTTTSQLGTTYETEMLKSIPTAGAGALGVINLSLLQAGVGSTGGLGAGTGPAVGGQRPRNNNFTIEGVDENDKGVTGPDLYVPNDAVQNFTILQNQFSAEFGHSTGGQFNTSVISGTNSYHGSAYEYFQNRNLNAIDNAILLTTEQGDTPKNPRYDRNRFGGQIGGPILKNKLFGFVNYERTPIGAASTPAAVSAPTAAGYSQMLAVLNAAGANTANISALQNWAVAPSASGTAAMCNTQLAASDPACAGGATTDIEIGTLPIQAPYWNNTAALTTSMDYNLSDRDQIRGRYVYNNTSQIDNFATLPAFYTTLATPAHLISLSEFHTFSPSITNELRLGYMRYGYTYVVGDQTFLPTLDMFPNVTMDDLGLNVGPDPNAPQYSMQNLYQLTDNLSWIKGSHTLKFGIEGRKYISPQKFIQRSRGDYEWPTLSDYAWDLNPLQSDVNGSNVGGFAERAFGSSGYSGDQQAIYWYVNDIWKVTRNLNLNFGLRYEYTGTPYGWTQQQLNSVADAPGLITFGSPQAPKYNFAPRIGFAYSPGTDGRMSIRGGFGLAYDVLYDNIGTLSRPPQIGSTIDCPLTCTDNAFLANGGIPFQNMSGITVLDQATARANTSSYLPNKVDYPYGESWNLGVQKVFGNDYTAEVRYVGSRGLKLNVQNRLNVQAPVTADNTLPTFLGGCDATCQGLQSSTTAAGQLTLAGLESINPIVAGYDAAGFNQNFIVGFMPYGSSTYHGLQAQLQHRMSKGLYFQGAYTYSHMIDNSTADFFSTVIAPRRPQDFRNLSQERADSVLDHRHRFTMSLVYDTQWFNHSSNWLAKNLLGGYEITPVYIYESGQWATLQSGLDSNLNLDNAGDRVMVNPAGKSNVGSDVTAIVNQSDDVVGYYANDPTARWVRAGTGVFATAGRSTFASPAINNLDLGVSKGVKVGERVEFRFGVLAVNVLNHPQYTTGFVSQANSVSATSAGQRLILEPRSSTVGAQSVGLDNFPNGIFGNFKAAYGSNARSVALSAKITF